MGVAQAGERWAPHLLRYSRLHSRKHQRARFIRNLTAVSMLRTPLEQASWHQLLWLARRLVAGAVDNPCPGAVHWGGPMDDPSSRLVPVRTTLPTRNTFYALRARGGEA